MRAQVYNMPVHTGGMLRPGCSSACHQQMFCCWRSQERQDGTNVNAWHWTEKDVSGWTKQRLGELLGGLQLFSDAAGSADITEVEAVKGELHA